MAGLSGIRSMADEKQINPALMINNIGSGYAFVLKLNGEPIYCGHGLSLFTWNGFPLKKGKNELHCIFTLLPGIDNSKIRFEYNVLSDIKPFHSEELKIKLLNGEIIERRLYFDMPCRVESVKIDKIIKGDSTDQDQIRENIKGVTLKLVKAISNRDLKKLSNILSLDNSDLLSNEFPPWFFSEKEKVLQRKVESLNDIDVLIGDHFVLSKPSSSYIENIGENSLYSVTSKKKKAIYNKNSFVFVLFQSNWHLRANNGQLYSIINYHSK